MPRTNHVSSPGEGEGSANELVLALGTRPKWSWFTPILSLALTYYHPTLHHYNCREKSSGHHGTHGLAVLCTLYPFSGILQPEPPPQPSRPRPHRIADHISEKLSQGEASHHTPSETHRSLG